MSIKLPSDWDVFYEQVQHKVKTLCRTGVWDIDHNNILAWLGNFTEDEHKYLAAHILDRLIYRNEKMAESAYTRFFSSFLIDYISTHSGANYSSVSLWLRALSNGGCQVKHKVKLCSVSIPGESGESGSQIIRLLTGSLFNSKGLFSTDTEDITKLKNNILLIVDDFVGSGDQFSDFADRVNLREASKHNVIIYAPLIGDEIGIHTLKEKYPEIIIHPLEVITEQDRLFSFTKGAMFCGDDINSEEDVLQCYNDMRKLREAFGYSLWLGRDKASLSLAFEWGCPNQSLGIIWYNTEPWHRLFRRRGST